MPFPQRRLPQGAIVTPVILESNKTSLSQFQGDQEVWPVYLSLEKHLKKCPMSAIQTCHSPHCILTNFKARMFHAWYVVCWMLLALLLLHVAGPGAISQGRCGRSWCHLPRWSSIMPVSHCGSIYCRFSRAVPGGMLHGKPMPEVYSGPRGVREHEEITYVRLRLHGQKSVLALQWWNRKRSVWRRAGTKSNLSGQCSLTTTSSHASPLTFYISCTKEFLRVTLLAGALIS